MKASQTVTIFEIIKNFISEILRQSDMELQLFNIYHLKSGAKFQKLLKRALPLDLLNQKYEKENQNAIATFLQNICTMPCWFR